MSAGDRRTNKPRPHSREPNSHRLLGIHIRTAGGLVTGTRHAAEIGCTTFQIMSGNPSAWNPGKLDVKQAELFRGYLDEHGIRPVFLHAGYLINLSCHTGRNAPLYAKSVKLLGETVERARALSCEYVVTHMGSRRGCGREEALAAFVDGLGRVGQAVAATAMAATMAAATAMAADEPLAASPGAAATPMLLLENGAGSGETVGGTFEELAEVLDAAEARGAGLPLGICLDTAHLWGAGYDMNSGAAARRMIDEFDRVVGIERLHLIHLNDSPVECGARRDKHEHIGHGLISVKGLEIIARHPKLRRVAMIMETPGKSEPSDKQRMDDLRELAGEPSFDITLRKT